MTDTAPEGVTKVQDRFGRLWTTLGATGRWHREGWRLHPGYGLPRTWSELFRAYGPLTPITTETREVRRPILEPERTVGLVDGDGDMWVKDADGVWGNLDSAFAEWVLAEIASAYGIREFIVQETVEVEGEPIS